jgi:protein-L-isoaspartate(D-aspartate) O-methyltransferase
MNKKQLLDELRIEGINLGILKAIEEIDRINFVPPEFREEAYGNYPLSIGYGQTISQPYTVGFMLQELELKKGEKVLEIGTGSGWNAGLISYLVGEKGKVYTTEIIKELAQEAEKKLKNCKNVKVICCDGSKGLKEYFPYDKIILTASPEKINPELKSQLKNNGILIAPVGLQIFGQKMTKIKRKGNRFIEKELGDFVFVPMLSFEK